MENPKAPDAKLKISTTDLSTPSDLTRQIQWKSSAKSGTGNVGLRSTNEILESGEECSRREDCAPTVRTDNQREEIECREAKRNSRRENNRNADS